MLITTMPLTSAAPALDATRASGLVGMPRPMPPNLGCSCFGCYKSFWARWDASPNRHVIHLILDAFEETLESKEANRKKKRGLKSKKIDFDEVLAKEMSAHEEKVDDDGHDDGYGHVGNDDGGGGDDGGYDGDDGDGDGDDDEEEDEEGKSSVRRFVSWVFGMNN
ncbi:transcription elongation factor SPT5-like [Asparagus officinalis]|uniref:transcription elongation factor SPT5-like n=1 Tax=Asparagus officinalis TaxID=4686 RepID=UPI00098E2563|nr:transcription elongation factor SPT5-like [Asparagus officinalis]